MGANEEYEIFAQEFYREFGYLPLGKDDPLRPPVEEILCDLGRIWGELRRKQSKKLLAPWQIVDALEGCRDLEAALGLFRQWGK